MTELPSFSTVPLLSFTSMGAHIFLKSGADYRTRTCDPLITNQVLYQLS
jgi:hypothetical protein